MVVQEALDFLSNHQPMPPDIELDKGIISTYDEARKLFLENKDPRCVPLFLNSFGERSGFGVYQLVEDVIRQFSSEEVVPYLLDSLKSKYGSVRYWSVQIAAYFPTNEIKKLLVGLLDDKDQDIKYATLTALGQFSQSEVLEPIQNFINKVDDIELKEFATEIFENLER